MHISINQVSKSLHPTKNKHLVHKACDNLNEEAYFQYTENKFDGMCLIVYRLYKSSESF